MYFIAVVLPAHLNQKIVPYKNYMRERYACRVALKSPAHITILPPYWMDEEHEQQLFADLDDLSSGLSPFQLQTNNFSAFKPRTIFIATKPGDQLDKVKNDADLFFSSKPGYKMKIDTRTFHPHITIATRDLMKKSFFDAWPHFQAQTFEEEWTVDSLSVLRHNKVNWDVVHDSKFR